MKCKDCIYLAVMDEDMTMLKCTNKESQNYNSIQPAYRIDCGCNDGVGNNKTYDRITNIERNR